MLSEKNIEFLKDLQHELNTQENDGNAEPLYWGIIEDVKKPCYDGCGDGFFAVYEGEPYEEENIDSLKESLIDSDTDEELLQEIEKATTLRELYDLFSDEIDLYEYESTYEVINSTGAFLTKREAKRYTETYYYNHKNARTYALTAYRNFELEELLKILKETDWEALKCLTQTEKN